MPVYDKSVPLHNCLELHTHYPNYPVPLPRLGVVFPYKLPGSSLKTVHNTSMPRYNFLVVYRCILHYSGLLPNQDVPLSHKSPAVSITPAYNSSTPWDNSLGLGTQDLGCLVRPIQPGAPLSHK